MDDTLYQFEWKGSNDQRDALNGVIEARSRVHACLVLQQQGVQVQHIRRAGKSVHGFRPGSIKASEVMVFSRQLANMLKAGIPLSQTLAIVAASAANGRLRQLTASIKNRIDEGQMLNEALAVYPDLFDKLYVNLVAVGEHSGTLDTQLQRIADYLEKRHHLTTRVHKALMYPALVLLMATAVTSLLLLKVVPQFASTFASFGAELLVFTQLVIDAARLLAEHGWRILIMLTLVCATVYHQLPRCESCMTQVDRLLLKLPVAGRLLRDSCLARICRTLATTLGAGIPVVTALQAVAGAADNRVYHQGLVLMAEHINEGSSLISAIRMSRLFPVMIEQLVHAGEESGTLDVMLDRCADSCEQAVDNLVDGLTSLLEPLVMAVLGIIIGGLMLAMYLPVFSLGTVL